jgi:hypothetical protein
MSEKKSDDNNSSSSSSSSSKPPTADGVIAAPNVNLMISDTTTAPTTIPAPIPVFESDLGQLQRLLKLINGSFAELELINEQREKRSNEEEIKALFADVAYIKSKIDIMDPENTIEATKLLEVLPYQLEGYKANILERVNQLLISAASITEPNTPPSEVFADVWFENPTFATDNTGIQRIVFDGGPDPKEGLVICENHGDSTTTDENDSNSSIVRLKRLSKGDELFAPCRKSLEGDARGVPTENPTENPIYDPTTTPSPTPTPPPQIPTPPHLITDDRGKTDFERERGRGRGYHRGYRGGYNNNYRGWGYYRRGGEGFRGSDRGFVRGRGRGRGGYSNSNSGSDDWKRKAEGEEEEEEERQTLNEWLDEKKAGKKFRDHLSDRQLETMMTATEFNKWWKSPIPPEGFEIKKRIAAPVPTQPFKKTLRKWLIEFKLTNELISKWTDDKELDDIPFDDLMLKSEFFEFLKSNDVSASL